jgi:hypothetical protein
MKDVVDVLQRDAGKPDTINTNTPAITNAFAHADVQTASRSTLQG